MREKGGEEEGRRRVGVRGGGRDGRVGRTSYWEDTLREAGGHRAQEAVYGLKNRE